MKNIILFGLSGLLLAGLVLPTSALARERTERDLDNRGRDVVEEPQPPAEEDDEGQGSSSGDNNSTVVVTNTVVISTTSGNQNESGDDGIETGDESAGASVETTVNGEVVQDITVSGGDTTTRGTSRSDRHQVYQDRSRGVYVETDVTIDEGDEQVEENEEENHSNDGADGQDGTDGQDGASGQVNPEDDDEVVEDGDDGSDDGRRERGDRDNRSVALGGEGGLWSRITNFMSDVLSLFFV